MYVCMAMLACLLPPVEAAGHLSAAGGVGVGDLVGDTCRVEGGVYSPFKNFISKIFLFLT